MTRQSKHDPIRIRDTYYPNAMEAAKAFGVSVRYILRAGKKGRLDMVGIPPHETRPTSCTVTPYRVMVRGQVFESVKDCADHFGITESTVRHQVNKGRADMIGLGTDRTHNKKLKGRQSPVAKPIEIGQFRWPSIKQASIALNVSDTTMRKKLKEGDREWVLAAVMRSVQKNGNSELTA